MISSFHHDEWVWSQSLYTPISVHFQENTMPVQGAKCKVQNRAQVIRNKNVRRLQYGKLLYVVTISEYQSYTLKFYDKSHNELIPVINADITDAAHRLALFQHQAMCCTSNNHHNL